MKNQPPHSETYQRSNLSTLPCRQAGTYDGGRVIEERDGSNNLIQRYIYGVGIDEVLILEKANGDKYWYYYDALGNVVNLTDNDGDLACTYYYDVYGDFTESGAFTDNPYKFTGRRYDPESDLYFYRARMYSPELGRFMQTDPVGYVDGPNLYTYVNNNPLGWIDPWGLASITNTSKISIPYKPEGADYEPPTLLEPGETEDVDGIYSPEGTDSKKQKVIKVPDTGSGVILPDGSFKFDHKIIGKIDEKYNLPFKDGKFLPRILCPKDLAKKEFANWPNPYTGKNWPYAKWRSNPCE